MQQVTTIRTATADDLDDLVAMGERFFAATPYIEHLPLDPVALRQALAAIVAGALPIPATTLVADRDGRLQGVIVAMIGPTWFDPSHRVATELAWWVDPQECVDGPRAFTAVRLQAAFEDWASEYGAHATVMSEIVTHADPGPTPLERIFRRQGYQPLERAYLRSK